MRAPPSAFATAKAGRVADAGCRSAAEIGFPLRREQHPARADVLRLSARCKAFGAGANDRERQVELEAAGSSLFHELYWLMLFGKALKVNRAAAWKKRLEYQNHSFRTKGERKSKAVGPSDRLRFVAN